MESEEPTRERILTAAAHLVSSGGIAALTTRSVAAMAGVQAPAIYRLFGDKRGLLDAVAEHGLAAFVARKAKAERHADPVQDLRDAWQEYITFGLENPAVFAIMTEVNRPGPPSPASRAGMAILHERVSRIARAGRLRIPQARAVALIHASGAGTIATLLASPEEDREADLPALALAGVLEVIIGPQDETRPGGADALAIGLRANLGDIGSLTPGERLLMTELLDRIVDRAGSRL